jgi:predicted transcriptional regulator
MENIIMELSLKEKEMIDFFRLSRSTKIQPVTSNMIYSTQYLSTVIKKNYKSIFNSLISKGLLKHTNGAPNIDYYLLTPNGEKFIYGEFDIETGLQEFMNYFKHFHLCAGNELSSTDVLKMKELYLTPIYEERIDEIIDLAVEREYITKKEIEIYMLSDKGERYVYKF